MRSGDELIGFCAESLRRIYELLANIDAAGQYAHVTWPILRKTDVVAIAYIPIPEPCIHSLASRPLLSYTAPEYPVLGTTEEEVDSAPGFPLGRSEHNHLVAHRAEL